MMWGLNRYATHYSIRIKNLRRPNRLLLKLLQLRAKPDVVHMHIKDAARLLPGC